MAEYTPIALQCQISTIAPGGGEGFPAASSCDTLKANRNGKPSATRPVVGSDRTSERLSISSTQYGPSVSPGVGSSARTLPAKERPLTARAPVMPRTSTCLRLGLKSCNSLRADITRDSFEEEQMYLGG